MITLQPIFAGDPFTQHPSLLTIWPEPSLARARHDTVESLLEIDDEDFGAICLILLDGQVIGITGYYWYDDLGIELGLRWHGLLPAFRGKGLSAIVIDTLLQQIRAQQPAATTLIELVPQTDYSVALHRHFTRLGFGAVGPLERYDWSDYLWQPYHLMIVR
jgi:RimJ/RimL family protein N-acetyltransferase